MTGPGYPGAPGTAGGGQQPPPQPHPAPTNTPRPHSPSPRTPRKPRPGSTGPPRNALVQHAPSHQRERRKRAGIPNYKLIRYADDFVIVVAGQAGHAHALHAELPGLLAPIGLRLAEKKTRVVGIDDGFVFLGFTIQRRRKRGTLKHYVYTVPAPKAIQTIKDRVSEATYRSTLNQDYGQLLQRLNRMLAGWANYFRHGVSKKTFNAIDSHAWRRIAGWLRRKHRIGRSELRNFCDRGWRFASNGVVFTGASSVAVTRYRYRGTRIPTPWETRQLSANRC